MFGRKYKGCEVKEALCFSPLMLVTFCSLKGEGNTRAGHTTSPTEAGNGSRTRDIDLGKVALYH